MGTFLIILLCIALYKEIIALGIIVLSILTGQLILIPFAIIIYLVLYIIQKYKSK